MKLHEHCFPCHHPLQNDHTLPKQASREGALMGSIDSREEHEVINEVIHRRL